MSAAAVLRSACRALRPARPPRALVANNGQPLPAAAMPRRLYSSEVNINEQVDRVFLALDEAKKALDTHNELMLRLVDEKMKYDRLKRVLLRAGICAGVAIFVKQRYFSGKSEEAAKKTTMSD